MARETSTAELDKAVEILSVTQVQELAQQINAEEAALEKLEAKIAPSVIKSKDLHERIKLLRAQMATALVAHNRHNIFEGGYQFTLKHNPPSFEVFNEELANNWAHSNNCLKIDMAKAKTLLKREILTPDGFVRSDSITISRSAEKAVDAE